ncbi:uncharacterized protein [Euphorbia lathyris]|uniref:uncharacterized protein isoform X2 n=1 Tax=Euphorbia lathyris TaxID=212925 RepID=UPI00331369A1
MGACVSRPRQSRRKISRMSTCSSKIENAHPDRSYRKPASQAERCDAISHESDEFYSVCEDGLSMIESERVSISRDANNPNGASIGNIEENNLCRTLSNNCLPCLASNLISLDKKKTLLSPSTLSSKRKLSFKWREGPSTLSPFSSKALLQKPLAGFSIPFCPVDKKMPDSWSTVEPSTFKVRGGTYFRDKKKDQASNCAAFHPFGADIFLSQKKINHIARFVELPSISAIDEIPSLLLVNIQMPLYPATIFQSESDGEGMNLVMYFKVSEGYSKELPSHFQESIGRLINDEVERVRGFPLDTIAPFRERLKILGRLANADELQLSSTERKLINAYNEKPVLSRPQHEFYLGENYLEIDIDMHRFSYISRKGFEAFQNRLKLCTLDFGLTIQGNKAEDLPEHMLCCIRLNELDHTKHEILGC